MKCLLVALLFLSFTSVAQARAPTIETPEVDKPLELNIDLDELRLPQYLPCTWKGERYACYTEKQQIELLKIEKRANTWSRQLTHFVAGFEASRRELVVLDHQLSLANDNDQLGRARVDVLTKQILIEIKKKNDWRAEAETPVVWPYIVGGTALAIAIGIGAGVYVSR